MRKPVSVADLPQLRGGALDDVVAWMRALAAADLRCHPEDSAEDIEDQHGVGLFTPEAAARYDADMAKATAACRAAGVDICMLGLMLDPSYLNSIAIEVGGQLEADGPAAAEKTLAEEFAQWRGYFPEFSAPRPLAEHLSSEHARFREMDLLLSTWSGLPDATKAALPELAEAIRLSGRDPVPEPRRGHP